MKESPCWGEWGRGEKWAERKKRQGDSSPFLGVGEWGLS